MPDLNFLLKLKLSYKRKKNSKNLKQLKQNFYYKLLLTKSRSFSR